MEPVIELTSAFLASVDRDYTTQDKYGPNYYDDPRAIALARIIENDLGVHQVQVLGGGSYGVAAATAETGGDVIKLTTDAAEVETGAVLTNTALDKYPANVVHLQGAWFVRRLRVVGESWFDPKKEESYYASKRIGLLRMERVHALNTREHLTEMRGLSEYVTFVKNSYKTWPHQRRHISRAAARERYLQAGRQLEYMLAKVGRERDDQIARDIALAIGQLRSLGIYGVDFHAGNVGWTSAGASPQMKLPGMENPVEETLQHRGQKFDLITYKTTDETSIYVRVLSFDNVLGPFTDRETAIAAAHKEIDALLDQPEAAEIIYKVFDIGESSVGAGAPKPKQVGGRIDETAVESPILARSVKVAELG